MADLFPMSKTAADILRQELARLELEQRRDIDTLLYPNGREEAYNRINAMCELSPAALGSGSISRAPSIWKIRTY